MASVVLGPGSVTVASKIGAEDGYTLLWVIVIAAICMGMYTTMSARFGVSHEQSILQTISNTYGRWFAVLIGISAFLSGASFQFGNNLGVATALHAITGISENIWPFVMTLFGVVLVFCARALYRVLEKLLMVMVMLMILAIFANLFFVKPDVVAAAQGFLPVSLPTNGFKELAALVGTTFVLNACLYQSYLVQDKGWRLPDLQKGMRDTISGIILLAAITTLMIITSAAAFHPVGIKIETAADLATQLQALFGRSAKYVFSLGLFAAAFSSLVVNAVIAGGLLSDGPGLGRTMQDTAPRIASAGAMLIGMIIATFFRGNIVYALVLAQASTLFAVPAIAIGLLLLLNNDKVMGALKNNTKQNIIAVFGLVLILGMVYFMYHRLIVFFGSI